jgi:prepilin-type N-terminal cleavage/methylation domain-containing protein
VARKEGTGGFTLLEVMIVVAVVAMLVALATFSVTRRQDRATVERTLVELQGRLERAQVLASVAGSRLGTARLAYGDGCTPAADGQLWVRLDGAVVEVPSQLDFDPDTDTVTLRCEAFNIAVFSRASAAVAAPAAPTTFSFTPSGRMVNQTVPDNPVFLQLRAPDQKTYGLRILPSGVFCRASLAGGPLCDEEV